MRPALRRAVLVLAAALAPATALACPPPPPGWVPPDRDQQLRDTVAGAVNLVEAVVTRSARPAAGDYPRGELRILRVYKGNLRVGQRLPFRFVDEEVECMPAPRLRDGRRGRRGLLNLSDPVPGPVTLWRFEPARDVRDMRRLGLLPAAR